MKSEIKTTNDKYMRYFYILLGLLIIVLFIFVASIFQYESELRELEKQNDKEIETAIQVGQNSTVNYIISNKKYPSKFKNNLVWLTKKDLCEGD